jgi:hypothetical protein
MNKGLKIIGFIGFLIVSIIIIRESLTPQSEKIIRNLNHKKNIEFSGIVQSKKTTPENHNWAFIGLENNKEINISNVLYDKINLNDSVVKKKNELIITIYRDKQEFTIGY